jgi:hypothetical protein
VHSYTISSTTIPVLLLLDHRGMGIRIQLSCILHNPPVAADTRFVTFSFGMKGKSDSRSGDASGYFCGVSGPGLRERCSIC